MESYCPHCGKKMNEVKNNKTLINFILDASGSMESAKKSTISGFNEYISNLKNDGNEYRFQLTTFNDNVKRELKCDIKDCKKLSIENYVPNGMTALYDAVCSTIISEKNYEGKVLTIIMTDGEENSSKSYTHDEFKNLIKELTEKGNHTFVFLGANQDSWNNASKLGFDRGNVVTYNSTDAGTQAAYVCLSGLTSSLTRSKSSSTKNFFTADSLEKIEKTK